MLYFQCIGKYNNFSLCALGLCGEKMRFASKVFECLIALDFECFYLLLRVVELPHPEVFARLV
jgi:hypothetical protein